VGREEMSKSVLVLLMRNSLVLIFLVKALLYQQQQKKELLKVSLQKVFIIFFFDSFFFIYLERKYSLTILGLRVSVHHSTSTSSLPPMHPVNLVVEAVKAPDDEPPSHCPM
jgi:hypothetical protein